VAKRGCGIREAGGVYLSTPLGPNGTPVEWFLVDPPFRVDAEMKRRLGLGNKGVKLKERPDREGNPSGIWDVWDVVGQNNYPNVADMIQEIKAMGVSRRIASNEDFAKLSGQSKLLLLHERAWIDNHFDYYGSLYMENRDLEEQDKDRMASDLGCPRWMIQDLTSLEPHSCDPEGNSGEMCLGVVYDDVEGGEELYDPSLKARTVKRTIGDTTYLARSRPGGIEPIYGLAVFGRFPIARIDVIRDLANGTHHERFAKAAASSLPVYVEEE
jgi:hypothetical protein